MSTDEQGWLRSSLARVSEWGEGVGLPRNHHTMKTSILLNFAAASAIALMSSGCDQSNAQTQGPAAASSTPTVGHPAEVFVDSGNTTADFNPNGTPDARGTLHVANDRWVCLKEGTSEIWIPRDRVVVLKISK